MFSQFRTRLTLAFGGSIGLILIILSLISFFFIQDTARTKVEDELRSAAFVQDRIWQMEESDLLDKARTLALDFGFRSAVATEDIPTIGSALINLKDRLGVDLAYAVLPDGRAVRADTTGSETLIDVPDDLLDALEADTDPAGVLELNGLRYQLVSAPVKAPRLVGWVAFAKPVNEAQLRELETYSPIPLVASIADADFVLDTGSDDIVSTNEIDGFGDFPPAKLVLRYSMSEAMKPYNGMFLALGGSAVAGLVILLACCWVIARGVTEPIRKLDNAVRGFADSSVIDVDISSRDEIGRLARSFSSMAEKITEREAHITRLSLTDTETDLPNRRALEQALEWESQDDSENLFVIAVSIDRFARIRNVIGQTAANDLMTMIGDRLILEVGVLAHGRLASDTIGLLMRCENDDELMDRFSLFSIEDEPFLVGSEQVDVQITAGFARNIEHASLKPVDLALVAVSQARVTGQQIMAFDGDMYGEPSGTLAMMSELMSGLNDGAVSLVYQPKYDVRKQQVCSAEALLRWMHPDRGFVRPDEFVENAEETGHIKPLTRWVVERAIADRDELLEKGYDLKIAINLSGRLVGDEAFIDWLAETLGEFPGCFCLEVTETAVIDDPAGALANIQKLRDSGVEISIDDYGSGLSSLSYLKQIPAHELKIDKAFVLAMTEGSSDALLVKSTIDLAHTLGLRVVAEGVETNEVLGLLGLMGADIAQGYHISRPIPLSDMAGFLREFKADIVPPAKSDKASA
ncbi:MAG: hypothetical protein CMK09_09530 [Ponticaulis sp.]|nr:hypothetical protein [Ponticaulis sp.]|tara:strand:+ start:71354 stop:73600 length:2247 start_codon:yes stop_codon:yes gene_type:complete